MFSSVLSIERTSVKATKVQTVADMAKYFGKIFPKFAFLDEANRSYRLMGRG